MSSFADAPATLQQLMPKQALTAVIEQICNRLLKLDNNARQQLKQIDNKNLTILINEVGFPLTFHISQGEVNVIANQLSDDCLIACRLETLAKLQQSNLLTQLIKSGELDIVGDVNIAQQFSATISSLEIDWDSVIAERIGDIPTHQLSKFRAWVKQKLSFAKQQISEDASEFILHEAKLVVSKAEIQQFNEQVAQTAQHVDNLAERVKAMSGK